jgi:hypothetical protein
MGGQDYLTLHQIRIGRTIQTGLLIGDCNIGFQSQTMRVELASDETQQLLCTRHLLSINSMKQLAELNGCGFHVKLWLKIFV